MTLIELFHLLRKHMTLVVVLPVVCAIIAAAFSWLVLPNTYSASVSMYVLNKASTAEGTVTNADLSASQMLTNDVASLAKSDRVQSNAAKELGLESLAGYRVSVNSQTTTRVMTISVTGQSPEMAAAIANQLAKTIDATAQTVMDVRSVNVIDQAEAPRGPSGPPRLMYTAVAFLAGLFIAIAIIVIMDMANTRVRSGEEASELLGGVTIIGRIPVIRN